jgi:hypothetical protein
MEPSNDEVTAIVRLGALDFRTNGTKALKML